MAVTFAQRLSVPALSLRFVDGAAFLRLEGEIDSAARHVLTGIARSVNNRAPAAVYVDLGGVSFASSVLINFLYRVAAGLPAGSALVVCRPAPATTRLIELTDIHAVVELDDDLPTIWPPDRLDRVDGHG